MTSISSWAALCLFFSSLAFAECEKIEYVEAREWTPAKVAKTFCESLMEHHRLLNAFERSPQGGPIPDNTYIGALRQCETQIALYQRIIENRPQAFGPRLQITGL